MRRAIAETALVAIILAVAGGLILAGTVGTLVVKSRSKISIDACKSNVEIAVLSKEILPVTKCYTKAVGSLAYSGTNGTYKDEMSAQVARLLYECRYQYGEVPHLPWKGGWFTNTPICSVCSTFDLPAEASSGVNIGWVVDWMKKSPLQSGESYYDYVIKSVPFNDPDYLGINSMSISGNFASLVGFGKAKIVAPEKVLDKGETYAVIHFGWPQYRASQVVGSADVATTLQEKGTTGEFSSVFIMPLDKLHTACGITFARYP